MSNILYQLNVNHDGLDFTFILELCPDEIVEGRSVYMISLHKRTSETKYEQVYWCKTYFCDEQEAMDRIAEGSEEEKESKKIRIVEYIQRNLSNCTEYNDYVIYFIMGLHNVITKTEMIFCLT